jgi:hypothetical protein
MPAASSSSSSAAAAPAAVTAPPGKTLLPVERLGDLGLAGEIAVVPTGLPQSTHEELLGLLRHASWRHVGPLDDLRCLTAQITEPALAQLRVDAPAAAAYMDAYLASLRRICGAHLRVGGTFLRLMPPGARGVDHHRDGKDIYAVRAISRLAFHPTDGSALSLRDTRTRKDYAVPFAKGTVLLASKHALGGGACDHVTHDVPAVATSGTLTLGVISDLHWSDGAAALPDGGAAGGGASSSSSSSSSAAAAAPLSQLPARLAEQALAAQALAAGSGAGAAGGATSGSSSSGSAAGGGAAAPSAADVAALLPDSVTVTVAGPDSISLSASSRAIIKNARMLSYMNSIKKGKSHEQMLEELVFPDLKSLESAKGSAEAMAAMSALGVGVSDGGCCSRCCGQSLWHIMLALSH